MKRSDKSTKDVISFLYELAQEVRIKPEKITELPKILGEYATNEGRLPLITPNPSEYYTSLVNEVLPRLQGANSLLSSTLEQILVAHPPLKGGMTGDHVSYEMVTCNEDVTALVGRFIDCWELG